MGGCDSRHSLFVERPLQPESNLCFGHKLRGNVTAAVELFK
jgi:hypothetical protein